MHELNRDVLSLCRPGAVAKGKQPSSLVQAACHTPASLGNTPCFSCEEHFWYGHALFEACRHQRFQFGLFSFCCHRIITSMRPRREFGGRDLSRPYTASSSGIWWTR